MAYAEITWFEENAENADEKLSEYGWTVRTSPQSDVIFAEKGEERIMYDSGQFSYESPEVEVDEFKEVYEKLTDESFPEEGFESDSIGLDVKQKAS